AAAIRRRCRSSTDSAASARLARALTSANTSRWRRLATISISPRGLRQRRARIRNPFAIRNTAARLSAEIPTRNAACRSGRGAGRGGRGRLSCVDIVCMPWEGEGALVHFAPGASGTERTLANGFLDGDGRERLPQQNIDIVSLFVDVRRWRNHDD